MAWNARHCIENPGVANPALTEIVLDHVGTAIREFLACSLLPNHVNLLRCLRREDYSAQGFSK